MPSSKEKRLEQQRLRRLKPHVEAPLNEAPKLKPRCYVLSKPYRLSDGQVHDPSTVPDPVIPDRVKISDRCSLPRHEFIRNLENCNRADSWRGNFSKERLDFLKNLI